MSRSLIKGLGHKLVLALGGDVHFFSCYRDDETLYVTSGGGGAFTSATHLPPPWLEMAESANQGDPIVLTEVGPPSPDRAQSRQPGRIQGVPAAQGRSSGADQHLGVGMPRSCRRWRFGKTARGDWTAASDQPIALTPLVKIEISAAGPPPPGS